MNNVEELLNIHLTELNRPFYREVKLIKDRRFKWDFVIDDLAIEIQGGIWRKKGAHNTGTAITRDCVKMRLAIMAGYAPVNFTTAEVLDGTAIEWIKGYLKWETLD